MEVVAISVPIRCSGSKDRSIPTMSSSNSRRSAGDTPSSVSVVVEAEQVPGDQER